jgi:hypothetical protein
MKKRILELLNFGILVFPFLMVLGTVFFVCIDNTLFTGHTSNV